MRGPSPFPGGVRVGILCGVWYSEVMTTKTSKIICTGCDFSTDVVYDAAAHSYALGKEHTTVTRPVAVKVEHVEEALAHLVAINEIARPALSKEVLDHIDAASSILNNIRTWAPPVTEGAS